MSSRWKETSSVPVRAFSFIASRRASSTPPLAIPRSSRFSRVGWRPEIAVANRSIAAWIWSEPMVLGVATRPGCDDSNEEREGFFKMSLLSYLY